MVEHITAEFGGQRKLAKIFVDAYRACKPGSPNQVAMASKLMDLILRNSQIYGDKSDLEQVSDAELEAELMKLAAIKP